MLKKNKFLLILIIIIFFGVFKIILCSTLIDNSLTASSNQNVNNIVVGPDLNSVDKEFMKIRDIPYNEKSMNCKNKLELFAAYLEENGA